MGPPAPLGRPRLPLALSMVLQRGGAGLVGRTWVGDTEAVQGSQQSAVVLAPV